jgi:hypothetical protein
VRRAEKKRLKRCRHRKANSRASESPSPQRCATRSWSPTRIGSALVGGLLDLALFFGYWMDDYRRQLKRFPTEYWFSLLALTVATIGVFGTWFGALRSASSAAKVHFDTGVIAGPGDSARSFATSKLHETLKVRLRLTPEHQDLGQVVITIAPPESVRLTEGCSYRITGMRHRRSCIKPSGQGRIEVERLAAGATLEVTAEAKVIHRIKEQEAIVIEMSSADTPDPNLKRIDLYSAKGTPGEVAAKGTLEEELNGPLHWVESTLQVPDDVFEVLGEEWRSLEPAHLHSFEQVPHGRTVDGSSLVNNHLVGAKIVTFESIVTSAPMRVRSFPGPTAHQQVFKEIFALGSKAGGRDLWCATTRGPDQVRLRNGDRVLVRAALIGWGLARPFGRQERAAMLLCPAVRLVDP